MSEKQDGHQTVTAAADKVPFWRKVFYGCGMGAYVILLRGVSQFANPIFNDCLGVDPRLVSWVLGGSRLWDAVTDPIMGSITDNTTSRWGRRRPWIALGALLSGITFAAIWLFPSGLSELAYFFWFLITSLIFFVAFTIFSVPYMALGMELSPDYNERTGVMAYRTVVSQLGAFLISGIYWFISLDRFDNMAHGMRYAGIIAGVLITVAALLPALFCREHPSLQKRKKSKAGPKVSLIKSFTTTMKDRSFLILVGINLLMLLGLTMVAHLGYYVTIYHIFGGEKTMETGRLLAIAGLSAQICTVFSVPVLTMLSRRIGKNSALGLSMILAIIGSALKWVCYTPANPWLSLIPGIVMGCGLAATWTLINAMLPDVIDLDDLKTGIRREGMYSAVHSWMCKVGMSLSLVISGYVLSGSGFNAMLGPDQAPRTIFLMRLFFCIIPVASIGSSLVLLLIYPLKEKRVREIRSQLEARNNSEEATAGS